ncbi:hypothetical protein WEH80_33405 [Actinomycetes bacterium KLBMP 9759]
MLWLFTQIWVWIVVALLLGMLAGWLFWARPLKRAADLRDAEGARPDESRAEESRADSSATN